jgi:microcystin degradation protein MlrC
MATTTPKRIALLGFRLESNGHAPIMKRQQFEEILYIAGQPMLDMLRGPASSDAGEITGFMRTLDEAMDWVPLPIMIASGSAGGPVDQAFFDEVMGEMEQRLRDVLPVDGVFIGQHGAATATVDADPDGTMFAMVRRLVGADVPVISTLDLHANVCRQMVDQTDLLISFLTNPHMDMEPRGREAGRAMLEMFDGMKTAKAFVKLPLIPPSVTQNTAFGPYGDIIDYGQTLVDDRILNVSICSGFSLGDTVKNGMSVTVTTRGDQDAADKAARDIATRIWDDRHRYVPDLTPLDEAARRMVALNEDESLEPLLFADVADNPGSGARGNTAYILKAFLDAGAKDVALAVFFDPDLAAEAHALGQGATFQAVFNRNEASPFSERLEAPATVMQLSDGIFVGRRGIAAGTTLNMGPSARLRVGGIDVVVISIRMQCKDPAQLESLGVDLSTVRGLVVKSRGHFRAGFDDLFSRERILEVDAPGLSTPVLSRVPYRYVPRPIFPLDPEMTWECPL